MSKDFELLHNQAELDQTIECRQMMERSLEALRRDVLPKSRKWFELMAEGPIEQIRKLNLQIDDYLSRKKRRAS